MLRLFVAVSFPAMVKERLAWVCAGVPGARWVDVDSMHLTLRFIGEVGGDRAEDIHIAMSRISAPAFDLTITGVDCFESGGKVHTLWAGVDKQPLLHHLRDKIESAVVRAGCDPERRKFKPHVTLARFKDGSSTRIGSFVQAHNRLAIGPIPVEEFILFRSHLSSRGPHYEALATYPLQGVRWSENPSVSHGR